jgi:hypothetical protein
MTTRPEQNDPQKTQVTATLWFVSVDVSADFVGKAAENEGAKFWLGFVIELKNSTGHLRK